MWTRPWSPHTERRTAPAPTFKQPVVEFDLLDDDLDDVVSFGIADRRENGRLAGRQSGIKLHQSRWRGRRMPEVSGTLASTHGLPGAIGGTGRTAPRRSRRGRSTRPVRVGATTA